MTDNQSDDPICDHPSSPAEDSTFSKSKRDLLELLTYTHSKPDGLLDDRKGNLLFGDQAEVGEGDVYLDICAPSLDLKTGNALGSQFDLNQLSKNISSDTSHVKSQGSYIPIITDLPEPVDSYLQTIKSEESLTTEVDVDIPETVKNSNDLDQFGGEALGGDSDDVAKTIKTEEEDSLLSITNLQESTSTSIKRRTSGRKRKQNPSYSGLYDIDDLDIGVREGEAQRKEKKKEREIDELYEPCEEEAVVKRKRGRPKKDKSSSLPPQSSIVNLENGCSAKKVEDKEKYVKKVDPGEKVGEFSCKDCSQAFVSSFLLKKHELTCKQLKSMGEYPVPQSHTVIKSKPQCPVCLKYFGKRSGVKRHLSIGHSNLVHITCRLCHKKVGDIDETLQHILSQHQSVFPYGKHKGPFCTVCGESFTKLSYLKQHVTNTHGNLLHFTCALCQRTVGAMLDYLQHFHTYHMTPSTVKGCGSDVAVTSISDIATQKDRNASQSELVCLQCNKTIDNYKLFILHTLSHKIDENMAQVRQLSMSDINVKQTSDRVVSTESDLSPKQLKAGDEFPVSLTTLPPNAHTSVSSSFSFLGYELVSALNRSLITMTEMSSRLHLDLQWNDSTCPKSKEDLSSKLSDLLRLSGGVTDIGKCLLLALEECKQLKGKDPLSDDDEDDNDNGEENDTNDDIIYEKDVTKKIVKNHVTQTAEMRDDVIDNSLVSFSQNDSTISLGLGSENFNEGNSEILNEVIEDRDVKNDESSDVICIGQTEPMMETGGCDNFNDGNAMNQITAVGIEDQIRTTIASTQPKTMAALDDENVDKKVGVGNKKLPKRKKKKHICKICGKHLAKASSLAYHRLVHIDIRPFQCKVCLAMYKSDSNLKRHSMIHLKDSKFKCDFCDVTVRTLKALHLHMDEHKTEKYFSCDKCKHMARTSYDLATHQKVHKPISCKQCDFQAKHLYDLRIHERKAHHSLFCPHCDYACATNIQLKRHLKTHDKSIKEKIYCCELCGATFDSKRKLSYHVVRHSNKTPLSCPHCDYKCSAMSSYQSHLLKHSGLRPYLCTLCGAGFQRSSHLKQHALSHSDVKQFECKTCGKGFKYRNNFREHMMIHTGEKKFKCHICDFACRRRKILDMHVAKHKARGSDVEVSENEADTSSNLIRATIESI